MSNVYVLDCTLRDGGYCNQWKFGYENIRTIISGLITADIDIIECGFLTDRVCYDKEVSKFNTVEEVRGVLPQDKKGKKFVCMMNSGEYDVSQLPVCDGTSIDGIRIAFHKHDLKRGIELCREVRRKGYEVYVQAMVSPSYTDEEFAGLIQQCNAFTPTAFYIVDSFGSMKQGQLCKLFDIANQNLDEQIQLGFHCHNNMQLAYANAQLFLDLACRRSRVVDCSVFGMGRGAGNLNTELFVEHLNELYGKKYEIRPLLGLIDDILNSFYQRNCWGYSLPNYLSAKHNIHPNYAGYLDDKKTLTIGDMDVIFSMMADKKKVNYDKQYIEDLYLQYMMNQTAITDNREGTLMQCIQNKTVLVIAPGKSAEAEKEKIIRFVDENDIVTISVNFDYQHVDTDFVFVSNLRRFKSLDKSAYSKSIVTTNIHAEGAFLQVNYGSLLCDIEAVRDNAGMMLIKYLIRAGAKEIVLAGMDGYRHDDDQNYAQRDMTYISKNSILDAMNLGMRTILQEFSKQVDIKFLTKSYLFDGLAE